MAAPVKLEDRIAANKKKLGDAKRPVLHVGILERHVGQITIDPAAETEVALMARQSGFEVLDGDPGALRADVVLKGEAFSEFAARRGNLISVKARVEVKAVERSSGKLLATDRETAVAVDLAEQVAGKTALQEAAARLAERLLPAIAAGK